MAAMRINGLPLAAMAAALFLSCVGSPNASSSATPAPAMLAADEALVREAVARRAEAVASGDKGLYLSLLARGDEEFLLEQSRWFDYRLSAEIADFELAVEGIEARGEGDCAVRFCQSYLIGADRARRVVRYTERYRRTGGTWLDADIYFGVEESEHFRVMYQEGIEASRAVELLGRAESAHRAVLLSFGDAPARRTSLKVFADRELLRQNSKITIDYLFSGWAEPGESIKLWLRPDRGYDYVSLIAHELVHIVTLDIAPNQCSWLAEGLANHYGNFAVAGADRLATGQHRPADYAKSIGWLGEIDPESGNGAEDWALYGGMAATVIRFLEERFGAGTPRALLESMGGDGREREGYVYALHDDAFREQLAGAIGEVLDLDMDELDREWLAWLKTIE
jgi:hypothetical protein